MTAPRTYLFKFTEREDSGTFTGLASVFDVKDGGGDIVRKGAFNESLKRHKAQGRNVAMLAHHDATKPIGVWLELEERGNALHAMGKFALETQAGREAHALAKMGALDGLSIGYGIPEGGAHYNAQAKAQELTKLDLWEISLVTFPMNESARIERVKAGSGTLKAPSLSTRQLTLAHL